jgi:arabinogalactan oligomer / maltooligosaccharide transport system substrate-binding protein
MSTRRVVVTALTALAVSFIAAGCAPKAVTLRPIAAPSPAEGMVVFVSGGVQVSRDGAWADVEPGDTVGAGAVLKTGVDGYCELRFGDAISVQVEPDTEFRCDRVAVDAQVNVAGAVTAGDIVAKVKRLGGSDLRIDTPSATLGVRGTAFKVSVSGTATRVTVNEGTVAVTREGATLESLTAGQRLDTDLGAGLTVQPADPADLEDIDAFVPAVVETADPAKLVKVVVTVEPADAEIVLDDGTVVGIGTWGAVLEEGSELRLTLRRAGYEDDEVSVPPKGQRAARIAKKLNALPAGDAPVTTPAPSAAANPGTSATETEPAAEPTTSAPAADQPATRMEAPAPQGPVFHVDPPIGNDPFIQWAAARFARQVPGFSLVTGPASANLPAAAWPRGADLVGGMVNDRELTYERLPQLVAAKLVRPLDGWYEWTQLAPVVVAAVRVGGRVYGVPIGGVTPFLYYNRDLVTSVPTTWQDIVRLAREYAPKGVDALVMPGLEPFFMGMFPESRGVALLAPDSAKSGLGLPRAAAVYDAMREAIQESGTPVGLSWDDAVSRFRDRQAALLIAGPWSFGTLRAALGDSLGTATLPAWGSPGVELVPYVNVFALLVSTSVSDERAAVLRRFAAFLLEGNSQSELAAIRLKIGDPIAPAIRFRETAAWVEQDRVISTLVRQLETAVPMPRGPLADSAWQAFQEVLEGIRRQDGGTELARLADARFVLSTLERRPVPVGSRELRAVIDPAEKSQGLFFRPKDGESDLRFVELGDSRGVVSETELGRRDDGAHSMLYLVVSHAPFRAGKAPALKGRIEYFDEPNATLRITYDSKDRSVRENPDAPDTWGAWKEAAFIRCSGTRTWSTAEFDLPDAQFDGRCNGADLRIEVAAQGKIPAVRSVILVPGK